MIRELPVPVLLVILIASAQATFPFTYQTLQLPVPITPHFLYGSIQENPTLQGYSYTTQDFNGGSSGVVFVSGPESEVKMKEELDVMKEIVAAGSQKPSEDNQSSSEMIEGSSTTPKSEESNATTEQDTITVEKVENKKEDKASDEKMNEKKTPQDSFFLPNPYSLFGFQSQIQPYPLNFQRFYSPPRAPGYLQPQGIFQEQYLPYNQYNAFQKNYYPPSLDYYYPSPSGLFSLQEFTEPAVNSIEEGKPAEIQQPLLGVQTSLPEQKTSTTETSSALEKITAMEDMKDAPKEPKSEAAASADVMTESAPATPMETTTAQSETETSTLSVERTDSETPSSPTEKP
ncbi:uncharacterized protein LOC107269526 [Cephus cinctus]|uniref:Uncharacterized protein LOC107269526 n=1 Tax=Cephus cinctus TaxID=211228 RepID=A0AAJ7C0J5_CEPCN|nr:uncharacterized protein LOC107269526 [Cephus cinctus]